MTNTNSTDDVEFAITRTFNAPRALVFKAMTDPAHLQHWWGPKGCTIKLGKVDFREGGIFHYCMAFPGGVEMWGRFDIREVKPDERLVFVNGFTDAQGQQRTRHPMAPTWPLEMLIINSLSEEGGKTILNLRSYPINADEMERQVFKAGHASMQGGFGGTYDQLDTYLAIL
jgi:uncharacterized protein YndB with AHSA1/START domain